MVLSLMVRVKRMKKQKKLRDLSCVRYFGLRHKVAHFFGIHSISRCMTGNAHEYVKMIAGELRKEVI